MARRPGVEIVRNLLGRRDFLKIAGATAVLPSVLKAQAKGQTAKSSTTANNRINIGVIGMGWQGPANTEAFLALEDCQVVAACDVDRNHLQAAVKMINDAYGTEDCKGYHDYRELLARPEIDAVMIAVPDHWHEIVATEAARRKKDIYSEKPLAHTIAEQQSIVRAVEGEQYRLADGLMAALECPLPQGGGNRPQRADRNSDACRGWPAGRKLQLRSHP